MPEIGAASSNPGASAPDGNYRRKRRMTAAVCTLNAEATSAEGVRQHGHTPEMSLAGTVANSSIDLSSYPLDARACAVCILPSSFQAWLGRRAPRRRQTDRVCIASPAVPLLLAAAPLCYPALLSIVHKGMERTNGAGPTGLRSVVTANQRLSSVYSGPPPTAASDAMR